MPEGHPLHGNPTLGDDDRRSQPNPTSLLSYTPDGDAFIVMASAGGSPTLPHGPTTRGPTPRSSVGAETFLHAEETVGPDRDRAFEPDELASRFATIRRRWSA